MQTGHCRRRKIRCLVAPDDAQGRCANCIRLKKECNFYPVEQGAENQPLPTGSGKEAGSRATASSATSSPRHPASGSSEKIEEFRAPFPGAHPTPTRYGMQGEIDLDPRQAPHSGASKYIVWKVPIVCYADCNSSNVTFCLHISASDRDSVVYSGILALFVFSGNFTFFIRILAAFTLNSSNFCIWQRLKCVWWAYSGDDWFCFQCVLWASSGEPQLGTCKHCCTSKINVVWQH